MVRIIYALVMCLVIAACNQSPQAIEAQKIDDIRKEQQKESEEFDRLVKRNPDVLSRHEPSDNNRLVTGDEQREIHDRVVSAINRERGGQTEQVTQSMTNQKTEEGPSRIYKNRVAKFSVEFPRGWEIHESSARTGAVIASNSENGSSLKISREDNDDNSPLTLNKARMVGENFFSQIQQHDPSARMTNADIIKSFNGHEAVFTLFKLTNSKVISFIIVPYNKYAYVIGFEGPEDVFRGIAGSSIGSFKIL